MHSSLALIFSMWLFFISQDKYILSQSPHWDFNSNKGTEGDAVTQNHRIVGAGRDLWILSSPKPCSEQVNRNTTRCSYKHLKVFIYIDRIPLNLLLSRLSSPHSTSLFWYERCSSPLIIFMALSALVPPCHCASCKREPRNGHTTPDVVSLGESKKEGSHSLTCWGHFSQYSQDPQLLLFKVAFSQSVPGLCTVLLLSRCRTWYSLLWNFRKFLLGHISSLPKSP